MGLPNPKTRVRFGVLIFFFNDDKIQKKTMKKWEQSILMYKILIGASTYYSYYSQNNVKMYISYQILKLIYRQT